MAFGAEVWGPALLSAAGSIGGGLLSNQGNKETKMQRTQRKLIDQLISSLNGSGPYADLFNFNEDVFNKSFVEPAKAKFRNQIAPQIQQQYIQSGQQRGTGLEDTLTRAGVDLDQMLNQYMFQAQENANNRKQSAFNSIIGAGSGAPNETSFGQDLAASTGGYLSSDAFKDLVKNIPKSGAASSGSGSAQPTRKGFAPDWGDWKLGDPRWGY